MTRGAVWAALFISFVIVGVSVVGGPYYEDSSVRSEPTFVPLGLSCTWDSPEDSVGPQSIRHPGIVGNVVAVVALLALVAFGAVPFLGPKPD